MNREEDEAVASLMRSLGIESQDEEEGFPSSAIALVLMPAGPKLKAFRERSGWTVAEISERTGVPLQVLEAFEAGGLVDEDVLLPALERVASACCCTLEELGLDRVDLHRPIRRSGRRRPSSLW
jgi:hypothetical protein